MSDLIPKVLAFAALVIFLGILIWHVPRIDLGAVLLLSVCLAAWDFFAPSRGK
jgi:hypothetical protein